MQLHRYDTLFMNLKNKTWVAYKKRYEGALHKDRFYLKNAELFINLIKRK